MDRPSYYPATPTDIPPGLAAPAPKYKTQIVLVLVSLVAFFSLYFGILAGCVLFFIWSIGSLLLPLLHVGLTALVVFQFFLCIPVLVLFIYMVKNLFRWGRKEKTDYVEVFADEQPRLFDFIYRVCDETGAPYPRHVYLNYEVNAMAFPEGDAFWHLLIPTDKNLLIGLGLLNAINLTEFQALLAHEFGHFSQKSMKLGAYVYTAMGIMNQIVDGRDFIDDFIDDLCTTENAIALIVGWIFFVVL
jgi:Zn-dependent protease with chaperone function